MDTRKLYYATVKRSFSYGELERHIWTPPGLKGLEFEEKVDSPVWVIYNEKGRSEFLVPKKKGRGFVHALDFGEIRDKDPKTIIDNIVRFDDTFRKGSSPDLRAVVCSEMENFFKEILSGTYKVEQTSSNYMPGDSLRERIKRIQLLI